ncbi:hypothetical protein [Pseudooceanicola nanhaiensis]|uniref:hypothetical protein n=1 Tax=Pseudooceanicola nanhaiensis TaxID=375761 RepID=UPI00405811EF
MLPENVTAVVARNETWSGDSATEPYEAGWAREAIIFVRALKQPQGQQPEAVVELSPDGIHWIAEGTTLSMPREKDAVSAARIAHFGNWLRLRASFDEIAEATVLVTVHLKA